MTASLLLTEVPPGAVVSGGARVGGLGMVASNTSNVNKSSGAKSILGQNETREERIKGSEARSSWKRNRFVEKGEAGCSLGGVRRKAEPYRV